MSSPVHNEDFDGHRNLCALGMEGSDTESEDGSAYGDDSPAVKVGNILNNLVETAHDFLSYVTQQPGHSLTSAAWQDGCIELQAGVTSLFNAYNTSDFDPEDDLAHGGTIFITDAEQTKYAPYGHATQRGLLDLLKVLADATYDSMSDSIEPNFDLPIEYGNKLKAVLTTLGTVKAADAEHKNRIKALADEGVVTQDQMLQGTLLLKEVLQDLERKTSV